MRTALRRRPLAPAAVREAPRAPRARGRGYLAVLAAILTGGLALRLWGIAQGLPYAYNTDEGAHFVPRAIHMFEGDLDPHYFANPPALTYLLHAVYLVWFGGAAAIHAFAVHPTEVYVLARVVVALLGTAALWLVYLAGARLFDRTVGLLAAALQAVAFLPVFYAHLALNDVPTLVPLTAALLGAAGVLRRGRRRDYLLAGVGLGLGCATKYTAGIVLLPLLAAAATQWRTTPDGPRRALAGLALAGAAAAASFLLANPYAVLDFSRFRDELSRQSQLSAEAQGKLGAGHEGGVRYYLWSLTWGFGWLPALAALGGALTVWRREQRVGWLLVPALVAFFVFMGVQGRYFGRWLLPIFPILCVLAAYFALTLVEAAARALGAGTRRPARALRSGLLALATLALCAQGLFYSVHVDRVLSRTDTRTLARRWMVAHIPQGAKIVVEPVATEAWVRDIGHSYLNTPDGARWIKYASLRSVIGADGALRSGPPRTVGVEDYERTLSPALIGHYEQLGYCWVISGSTESGRAYADPRAVPYAVAYYQALARQARVVYRASPYAAGARPAAFNFDWSFDYYPLAYDRPGPQITVYRLTGGSCGR